MVGCAGTWVKGERFGMMRLINFYTVFSKSEKLVLMTLIYSKITFIRDSVLAPMRKNQ